MAMLAPYTNAMRLGQGFNSYTQQICLDKAVVIPRVRSKASKPGTPDSDSGHEVPAPGDTELLLGVQDMEGQRVVRRVHNGQSQIVTYTAKFIDKLSDITASLSIKTATIGGSVKGSYVDTDKFKSSDMNFTIQVKVINQYQEAPEYSEFNMVEADAAEMNAKWDAQKFTKVYGDCFISGWETGGELNALISVKMLDKSKTNAIKGALEGSLGTPALSCEVKGGVDKVSNHLETNTETTVSVNYSGGGRVKDENVLWNINSLTLAAANFADKVADTPQKIYAILTKYTNLYDYQKKFVGGKCSPLIYENASIYTNSLLDNFMDYKFIWKQIQIAMWEVENKRATVQKAKFSQSMKKNVPYFEGSNASKLMSQTRHMLSLLNMDEDQQDQIELILSGGAARPSHGNHDDVGLPGFVPNLLEINPYEADLFGLEKARRDCRLEMVKIVNEVESVTLRPQVSLDPTRDGLFLPPVVYRQMLPVVIMSDNTDRRILGTSEEADFPMGSGLWLPQTKPFDQLDQTLQSEKVAPKALHFRVDGWSGQEIPDSQDTYFESISWLHHEMQPQMLVAWYRKQTQILLGMQFLFTNGSKISCGTVDPPGEVVKAEMQWEPQQQAQFVNIGCVAAPTGRGQQLIDHLSIGFTSNAGGKIFSLTGSEPSKGKVTCFKIPLSRRFWDFRGFYGATAATGGFSMLGPIWCNHQNDWSPTPLTRSICPGMENFPEKLRLKVLEYQKQQYNDYQFSVFGGDPSSNDCPADAFFCTLSGNTLSTGAKFKEFGCKFVKDKIWMSSITLSSVESTIGSYPFGNTAADNPESHYQPFTSQDEVVGCTVFSATSLDAKYTWCIGLELQIESQNNGIVSCVTKRMVSAKLEDLLKDPAGVELKKIFKELHSHVLHPPREPGRWVIRGFWGQSGQLIDRFGVVWKKI